MSECSANETSRHHWFNFGRTRPERVGFELNGKDVRILFKDPNKSLVETSRYIGTQSSVKCCYGTLILRFRVSRIFTYEPSCFGFETHESQRLRMKIRESLNFVLDKNAKKLKFRVKCFSLSVFQIENRPEY